jgi:hypothetical protein
MKTFQYFKTASTAPQNDDSGLAVKNVILLCATSAVVAGFVLVYCKVAGHPLFPSPLFK